jgi:tetratricopeptide (TPR) repeat protein
LQTAEDHYLLAGRIGRDANDPEVRVRASLGLGAISTMRGNYPKARATFRQALRNARVWGVSDAVESLAHKGLLVAAVAAKDADSALIHGWHAFQRATGNPDEQAELAIALGEVALLAGQSEAALRACLHAIELATTDRVRLGAYGSAALAAARLGRRDVLDVAAAAVRTIVQGSQQTYDVAYTLLELAEAFEQIDARAEARVLVTETIARAKVSGFHELAHRAETLEMRLQARVSPVAIVKTPAGGSDFHDEVPRADILPNLSRASRSVIRSLVQLHV